MNQKSRYENVLEVQNLRIFARSEKGPIPLVDDISFSVRRGKTLGLVGESGCGKSLTSLSLMRLLPESCTSKSNGILFENQDLSQLTADKMEKLRGAKLSMIFQNPMTSLNPVLTIGHQLDEVYLTHQKISPKEAKAKSIALLANVKIPDAAKKYAEYPHQLSGGMRQRVMIAMGLACSPDLLIADEPTTALDVTIQAQILSLMNDLQTEHKMSMIFITHDLGVVAQLCDDVAVMYAGKIVEVASTKDLFAKPAHPYTMGLFESIPKIGEKAKRLKTIPGRVPKFHELPKGCRFQDRCPFAFDRCRQSEPPLLPVNQDGKKSNGDHKSACFLTQP